MQLCVDGASQNMGCNEGCVAQVSSTFSSQLSFSLCTEHAGFTTAYSQVAVMCLLFYTSNLYTTADLAHNLRDS